MNNLIQYFYNIKVDKIVYNDIYYSFVYDDYIYRLYIYDDNFNNVKFLYEINKILIKDTLMSEIIINKNNEILSVYNDTKYILIRLYVNINKSISLDEISLVSSTLYRKNININWGNLWEKKIDYLENLINENGKKYPLLVDSFNYFVGMAENAISYYNTILIDNDYQYVISHKIIRWDDNIDVLYNPLNIIFDYKVRDVAEYIKNSFFCNNHDVFKEFNAYLQKNLLSVVEAKLLVSRLLYPSFYFEMYEDILIHKKEEKIILDVISKLDDYEQYLSNFILFLKNRYNIDEIEWLKKRRY